MSYNTMAQVCSESSDRNDRHHSGINSIPKTLTKIVELSDSDLNAVAGGFYRECEERGHDFCRQIDGYN